MDLPLPVRCVRWWSERLLELALVLACVAEGSTNLGAISTSFGLLHGSGAWFPIPLLPTLEQGWKHQQDKVKEVEVVQAVQVLQSLEVSMQQGLQVHMLVQGYHQVMGWERVWYRNRSI